MKRTDQHKRLVRDLSVKFGRGPYINYLVSHGDANHPPRREKRRIEGEIGIELEAEGRFQLADSLCMGEDEHWQIVEEGSLRNGGHEFVTKMPVNEKDLDVVLDRLFELTKGTQFNQSIRTSLHIHINVLNELISDVFKIIGSWWLIENILVEINGKERIGNLFCLRAKDAEDICELVQEVVCYPNSFWDINSNTVRYGAQNIGAVQKYGSLEYRFMRGYTNPEDIKKWAVGLLNFHRVVLRQFPSLLDVVRFVETSSPIEFLNTFLTDDLKKDVLSQIPTERLHSMMMENFCHTYRLAIALEDELFEKPHMGSRDPSKDQIDDNLRAQLNPEVEYDIKYRKGIINEGA